jgi:hypothetical protein
MVDNSAHQRAYDCISLTNLRSFNPKCISWLQGLCKLLDVNPGALHHSPVSHILSVMAPVLLSLRWWMMLLCTCKTRLTRKAPGVVMYSYCHEDFRSYGRGRNIEIQLQSLSLPFVPMFSHISRVNQVMKPFWAAGLSSWKVFVL